MNGTNRQQVGFDQHKGSNLMASKTYPEELYLAWGCLTE
jgi:hypothetical protein